MSKFVVKIEYEDSSNPIKVEDKVENTVSKKNIGTKKNNKVNRQIPKRKTKSVDKNVDFESLFSTKQNAKEIKKKEDKKDDKVKEEVQKLWKEQLCLKYGDKVIMGLESSSNLKPNIEKKRKNKEISQKAQKNKKLKTLLEKTKNTTEEINLQKEDEKREKEENEDVDKDNEDQVDKDKTKLQVEILKEDAMIDIKGNPYFNEERLMDNCLVINIPDVVEINLTDAYNHIIYKMNNLADFIFFTKEKITKAMKMKEIIIRRIHLSFESQNDLFSETTKIKRENLLTIFSENEEVSSLKYKFVKVDSRSLSPLFNSTMKEIRKLPSVSTLPKTEKIYVNLIDDLTNALVRVLGEDFSTLVKRSSLAIGFSFEVEEKRGHKSYNQDDAPIRNLQLSNKTTTAVFNISKWNYSVPKELSDVLSSEVIRFVTLSNWEANKFKNDYDIKLNYVSLKSFDVVQRCKPCTLVSLSAFFLRVFLGNNSSSNNNNNNNNKDNRKQNHFNRSDNRSNQQQKDTAGEADSPLESCIISLIHEKVLEVESVYDRSTGKLDLQKK